MATIQELLNRNYTRKPKTFQEILLESMNSGNQMPQKNYEEAPNLALQSQEQPELNIESIYANKPQISQNQEPYQAPPEINDIENVGKYYKENKQKGGSKFAGILSEIAHGLNTPQAMQFFGLIANAMGKSPFISSSIAKQGDIISQQNQAKQDAYNKYIEQMRDTGTKYDLKMMDHILKQESKTGKKTLWQNPNDGTSWITDIKEDGSFGLKQVNENNPEFLNYEKKDLFKKGVSQEEKFGYQKALIDYRTGKGLELAEGKEQIGLNYLPEKERLKGEQNIKTSHEKIKQENIIKSLSGLNTVNTLKTMLNEIPVPSGPEGILTGLGSKVSGKFGINEKAAAYDKFRKGIVFQYAKDLGNTGTPSDRDMERSEGLIPKLTDPENVRKQKWKNIENFYKSKINLYNNSQIQKSNKQTTNNKNNDPAGIL